MPPQIQQPRPGYAGVTVWIGDKSVIRIVPEEAFEKMAHGPMSVTFADANADLRMAQFWGSRVLPAQEQKK